MINNNLPETKTPALSEFQKKRKKEYLDRYFNAPEAPRVVVSGSKETTISISPHPDMDNALYCAAISEAFGTLDSDVINVLLNGLTPFVGDDTYSEKTVNTALALMHDIKPTDTVETMLAIQMIATHTLAIKYMRQMVKQGSMGLDQVNFYMNAATKLSRTYISQMEAMNRHRGKGQQKMTVEHVHVNEGGQAIIGNVERQGGRNKK